MNDSKEGRRILLVGSIPLRDAREVFEAVSTELGPLVARIPDGETGDRSSWIQFQKAAMDKASNLAKSKEYVLAPGIVQTVYTVVNPHGAVVFGELRYASEARRSYQDFSKLKASGMIPRDTRFQVSFPTPLAVVAGFIELGSQEQVEAAYKSRLLEELGEILEAIPVNELSIQWDVAYEILFLDGWTGSGYFDQSKSGLLGRLVELGNKVPVGVELGYHLCYGDPGHMHLLEPRDLGLCVEVSNVLAERVQRVIQWVHMPVPRDRSDDTYFAPLSALKTPAETEIFIGLVHHTDGVKGARRRLEAAGRFREDFGIATECGFGRRAPGSVRDLLSIHKQVATI